MAQENSDAIEEDLKFVKILFMVFAGVALFVGSFIIWNTFTMIVTQRSGRSRAAGHRRHPAAGAPQPVARGPHDRRRRIRHRRRPRSPRARGD